MTTKGQFLEKAPPSTTKVSANGSGSNPSTGPQTPKEGGWWGKASPWVHGALGVASFVPGLSVVTGGLGAAIYAAEGNMVEAGIAAVSMLPGGKVATTAGKVIKGVVGLGKEAKVITTAAKTVNATDDALKACKLIKKEIAAAKKAEKKHYHQGQKAAQGLRQESQIQRQVAQRQRAGEGSHAFGEGARAGSRRPNTRHARCWHNNLPSSRENYC